MRLKFFDFLVIPMVPVIRVITDPVRCRRDPVINAGLSWFSTRKTGRHDADQNPTSICLLNLQKKNWNKIQMSQKLLLRITIKGPPESPLQESLPPSRYPAHTISGQIFTYGDRRLRE